MKYKKAKYLLFAGYTVINVVLITIFGGIWMICCCFTEKDPMDDWPLNKLFEKFMVLIFGKKWRH